MINDNDKHVVCPVTYALLQVGSNWFKWTDEIICAVVLGDGGGGPGRHTRTEYKGVMNFVQTTSNVFSIFSTVTC